MASEFNKPFLENLKEKNWSQILVLCLVSTCIALAGGIVYLFFLIGDLRKEADEARAKAEQAKTAYYEPIISILRYKIDSITLKKIVDQDRLLARFQGLDSSVDQKKAEVNDGLKTLKRKAQRNSNTVQELIKK